MTTRSLLTPKETAEVLGIATQTLAAWRTTGRHDLPFVKIGTRVRYRPEAVEEFIAERESGDDEDEE